MSTDVMEKSLEAALVTVLPLFVKEPFSDNPKINVPELYAELRLSRETVYKWLRTNRLTPKNVKAIVKLAGSEKNLAALKQLDRTPPVIEDFARFCFA